MARIQILELPMLVNGDYAATPFAIIIDQVRPETEEIRSQGGTVIVPADVDLTQGEADRFAASIGAQGALITSVTLDVA